MEHIVSIAGYIALFSLLDRVLTRGNVQGVYYAVHALHNAAIVYLTLPDVVHTLTEYHTIATYPVNHAAVSLCLALHLYHILLYYPKFRMDDWLHHGLMIGVALPIAVCYESHTLFGATLFMTTGLPGGIDYTLLCGVRNGLIHKDTEKNINAFLNVWVRSPGCAAIAALSLAHLFSQSSPPPLMFVPPLLTYWNGQYFMRQVVEDQALRSRL